jgi:protein phosphatase methylesterase 1
MSVDFILWNQFWERKSIVSIPGRGDFNGYFVDGAAEYVIVAIHGAGHSGLSFSLLASHLKGVIPLCVLDLKCHADTPGDESTDLAIDALTADVVGFCRAVQPPDKHLILIGHSLGGSIAALQLRVSSVMVINTIKVSSIENLPQIKTVLGTPSPTYAHAAR